MTIAVPTETELTGVQRYTILVAFLTSAFVWFKTAQFTTVAVLHSFAVGYGYVWATIAAEVVVAGIALTIYFVTKGAATGRMYRAALGTLGLSILASGITWAVMTWAVR